MELKQFIPFIIIITLSCANDKKKLMDDCMTTFADKDKCESFVSKNKETPKKISEQKISNDGDLKNRSEIKNTLQNKNKLFVIKYLGNPDERTQDASGEEYFTYTRPISKYSDDSDPDTEIKVFFRRGQVERIVHTAPPNNINNIFKLIEKKK